MLRLSLPSSFGVATYPPGATFGPRHLQDFEFVWVLEGHARYVADGLEHPLPAGSLLLCRPCNTDFFSWDPMHHTRHAYFHFQVHQTPDHWPVMEYWPVVRLLDGSSVLSPLFEHLLACAETAPAEHLEHLVSLMLTAFVDGHTATRRSQEQWPRTLEQVMRHVQVTLDTDSRHAFSLEELSGVVSVTPEYLCRLFKKHTGHAPLEWVRLLRLDRALSLVTRTNYTFGEISDLMGFASPFHFSRRFKLAYGLSPREVRENARAGRPVPASRLVLVKH
ncbi:helix-turn-helix transcriptional regulator [Deinococcus cellulosilyticus]|uniref:AraC family transcriptional regulator n=1 Tax=Deinococcus cellulosilyticus (strain DSM 18568 / NBRC 106333 / KACC 11606 / 5516J-15) TaxID=1223518 RepID=A0A511N1H4_DEIC1|nr:AraC family transcriptional regulator [Deinococcus cellulosilyticus]GEM46318.1 AraC family transcriptional regulator [Deinococcus cellulosilyticus NBRC 106333 = KACC 11606]